jgi:hypothetical protein
LTDAVVRGPVVINAVGLAEIALRFFRVEDLGAALPEQMLVEELPRATAFLAGHTHVSYRRAGGAREQILADFLVGLPRRHHTLAPADARPAARIELPAGRRADLALTPWPSFDTTICRMSASIV